MSLRLGYFYLIQSTEHSVGLFDDRAIASALTKFPLCKGGGVSIDVPSGIRTNGHSDWATEVGKRFGFNDGYWLWDEDLHFGS